MSNVDARQSVKWTGQALQDLLNLKPAQIAEKYGFKLDYVYTARRRAKLKQRGTPTMPESAPGPERREVGRTEYEMLTKNADGEAEIHQLKAVRYETGTTPEDRDPEDLLIRQAAPVTIRPSRARAPKREAERVLFFGDTQIAYGKANGEWHTTHDEAAMYALRGIARAARPDQLINLGDTVDFPTFSRFPADSNRFEGTEAMQMSIDRAHRYWAELGADNPQAKKYEVDSNHTIRVDKMALNALSQFYGVRRAGDQGAEFPFLTYAWLMNFEALGVTFDSGYGAVELPVFDDLIAMHGKESRSSGSTAHMMSRKYPTISTVRGHDHRYQVHTTTDRDGNYRYHVVVPALCDIWGNVSGYNSAIDAKGNPVRRSQGWQQGAVMLERYPDGSMNWQFIPIKDGIAHFEGQKIDGNPEAEEELRRINSK